MESMASPPNLGHGFFRKRWFWLERRSRPSDCSLETGNGGPGWGGTGGRGGDIASHNTTTIHITDSFILSVDVSDPSRNNIQLARWGTESSNIKSTGQVLQTITEKLGKIGDTDPAKVALGLVKAIIEIKNVRCRFSHCILTDYYSRM